MKPTAEFICSRVCHDVCVCANVLSPQKITCRCLVKILNVQHVKDGASIRNFIYEGVRHMRSQKTCSKPQPSANMMKHVSVISVCI